MDRESILPLLASSGRRLHRTWEGLRAVFAAGCLALAADRLLAGTLDVVDTSFATGLGANGTVQTLAVQPDGKILVGGWFTNFNGMAHSRLARLRPDGTIDPEFDPATGAQGTSPRIYCLGLQPDGKILAGGGFTAFGGLERKGIVRLNTNGTVDTLFVPTPGVEGGGSYGSFVYALAVQPDGKILIGGDFTVCNQAARTRLARLHADGTLDTSFEVGAGASDWVTTIAVLPDERILIGGEFLMYGGVSVSRIARLSSTGTRDPSFSAPADRWVQKILPLQDGKLLVGGKFLTISSQTRRRVARLEANGAVDATFSPAYGVDGGGFEGQPVVVAMAQDVQGLTYIAGDFTNYNQIPRLNLARLHPDGALDTNFPAFRPDGRIWALALQTDGRVLVGGEFTNVNGVACGRIARLRSAGLSIAEQPRSVAVSRGGTAQMGIAVQGGGEERLAYQWWFNGRVVPGETNSTLTLTNVQEGQTGAYVARVAAGSSSLISEPAILTVTQDVPGLTRAFRPGDLPEGLAGWWKFDGDATDSGPNGYHLTASGNPTFPGEDPWLEGEQSGHLGTSDSWVRPGAASPNLSLAGTAFTMAAWIKIDAWQPFYNIIVSRSASGTGYGFYTAANGYLAFGFGHTTIQTEGPVVTLGTWHHVAASYDQGRAQGTLYLDGNPILTRPVPADVGDNAWNFEVGYSGGAGSAVLAGGIKDLAIWTSTLSTDQLHGLALGRDPNGPPVFSAQPVSLGLPASATAALSVAAVGTGPFHYQWFNEGLPIEGALSSALVLRDFSDAQAGSYFCVVSNNFGAATSVVASVVSQFPPALLSQPEARFLAENGLFITSRVDVVATTPTYQWLSNGIPILNETNQHLLLSHAQTQWTGDLSVVVSNAFGVVTSSLTRIVVPPAAIVLLNGATSSSNRFERAATNQLSVSLQSTFANGLIFYTLDGSDPDPETGFAYGAPFTVTGSVTVRAIAFSSDGSQSVESAAVSIDVIPVYSLTDETPGGGNLTFDPPGGWYGSNSWVTVRAVSGTGWSFLHWAGAADGTNHPLLVRMDSSKSIGAVFGTTATTNTPTGGAISLWPPEGPYPYGSTVRLVGVPASNKYFSRWFNALSGPTNNPLSLSIVSNNPVVSAFFSNLASTNFTLTTLVSGPGTVSRNPMRSYYASNAVVQLTAEPDPGFVLVGWTGDASGQGNPMSITMNSNRVITATFAPGQSGSNAPSVALNLDGPSTVASGALLAFAASVQDPDTNETHTVVLFREANPLGTSSNAPFTFLISNTPPRLEPYAFRAVATDSTGLSGTSAPVWVTVTSQPPVVRWVAPVAETVLTLGAAVEVRLEVTDEDTPVDTVEVFSEAALLGRANREGAGTEFRFAWTPLEAGAHELTARATDALGITGHSAAVRVYVIDDTPRFRLATARLEVNEAAGFVDVIVEKLGGRAGSFAFTTSTNGVGATSTNSIAFPANSAGQGDFHAQSGTNAMPEGAGSWSVRLVLVDDGFRRTPATKVFRFEIAGLGDSHVEAPTTMEIGILDDDQPLGETWTSKLPRPRPVEVTSLTVELDPEEAGGRWRFPWELAWRESGGSVLHLEPGAWELEFMPRHGFLEPTNQIVELTSLERKQLPLTYIEGTPQETGGLEVRVMFSEAGPRGRWRLADSDALTWRDSGDRLTNLSVGWHGVEFEAVGGFERPVARRVWVQSGMTTIITGYHDKKEVGAVNLQVPLSGSIDDWPYAFCGQLVSDAGYSSGMLIRPRVVVTAAHALFLPGTATPVRRVRWFPQRHRGQWEPLPLEASGWYVLSNYVTLRARPENLDGRSATIREHDLAAVYFDRDAGREGFAGYLVAETNATQWLGARRQRYSVGYPLNSQAGLLHVRDTAEAIFAQLVGSTRVFATSGFGGEPGASGGPLCLVLGETNAAPAAVYLGQTGDKALFRVIDREAATLIERAELSSYTGQNHTGGGIPFVSTTTNAAANATVTVLLTTHAVRAGIGWRVDETSDTNHHFASRASEELPDGEWTLTFTSTLGLPVPMAKRVRLGVGEEIELVVDYGELRLSLPLLPAANSVEIEIKGPPGTPVILESSADLRTWRNAVGTTNTLTAEGTLRLTIGLTPSPAFFRARTP